jgi:hypothetical protein
MTDVPLRQWVISFHSPFATGLPFAPGAWVRCSNIIPCIEYQDIIDRILAHLRDKNQDTPTLPHPAPPTIAPPATLPLLEQETAAGGRGWNPFESGRTLLELRAFYRDQKFTGKDNKTDYLNETSGLKFTLDYDNADWYNNPAHDTSQQLTFAKDYGWLDKSVGWTAVSFRHSQYWNPGSTQ